MSRNGADKSADAEPIRWLHLSDLHLGCRGEPLWAQVQEEFERSVCEHVAEFGMPDLILFTGDLTNRGSEAEFDQVDAFLDALLGWLADASGTNREPLIVPVPGNHDLVRPEGKFPLLLVGLNSSWMQYQKGDFQGMLELPVEQFHAALGDRRLARFKEPDQALLMMHHPLDWLSTAGRLVFAEAVYTPGRFSLCLHGHMHSGRSESVSVSGGVYRHWFQSPSLFGLQHYGSANEDRAMGYAWGELSHDGQVRVWPLRRTLSGGEMAFVPDQAFRGFPSVIRQAATDKTSTLLARDRLGQPADDGRFNPWGSEAPDPERANFDHMLGRPSPVGVYPAGNGSYGHCDLAGNVWEWCTGIWPGYRTSEEGGAEPAGVQWLRGVGCGGPPDSLRAAYRYGKPAGGGSWLSSAGNLRPVIFAPTWSVWGCCRS